MKILLYFEGEKAISTSGIGRALRHQMKALDSVGIPYTTNPNDSYDLLHINTYFLNSESLIKKTHKEGKGVIYHAHSTEEDFKNSFIFSNQISPLYKKHLVNLYSMADELITPTPYSKKIIESYGITQKITAISNGIDMNKYEYCPQKVKAFRKYFSLNDDDKVVLGVGLLFERKGILDFIEIAEKMPEYKFIWFGDTPMLSIPKNIRDKIESRPDNLIMPGYVKGPIIEGAYSSADCFFFPSYEETEGIVVLEALASKQLVIVRDIGVFDPWLVNGKNCLKADNNLEFEACIQKAMSNKMDDIRINGYHTAEERTIENVGKQLKEVYDRVYNEINLKQ